MLRKKLRKIRAVHAVVKRLELNPLKRWQWKAILEDDPYEAYLSMPGKGNRGIGKTTTVFLKVIADAYGNRIPFSDALKCLAVDPDYDLRSARQILLYRDMWRNFFCDFVDKDSLAVCNSKIQKLLLKRDSDLARSYSKYCLRRKGIYPKLMKLGCWETLNSDVPNADIIAERYYTHDWRSFMKWRAGE